MKLKVGGAFKGKVQAKKLGKSILGTNAVTCPEAKRKDFVTLRKEVVVAGIGTHSGCQEEAAKGRGSGACHIYAKGREGWRLHSQPVRDRYGKRRGWERRGEERGRNAATFLSLLLPCITPAKGREQRGPGRIHPVAGRPVLTWRWISPFLPLWRRLRRHLYPLTRLDGHYLPPTPFPFCSRPVRQGSSLSLTAQALKRSTSEGSKARTRNLKAVQARAGDRRLVKSPPPASTGARTHVPSLSSRPGGHAQELIGWVGKTITFA